VLTWLTFSIKNPLLDFYMKTLGWLLFYIWLMRLNRFTINRIRLDMGGTLFWIFLFSSSITAIIIEANKEKEWEQRKKMADSIALLSDPYNERELSISLTYLDEDFLEANFNRFREENTAQELRDSILRESGYLSRYNTRLYVFDKNNKPLFNEEAESFNALNTILRLQAKPTHAPHLYYYETSFDRYTYIFKREARDASGKYLGSVFILSDPEQYSTEALYPELFRRPNQELPDENPIYAYAVYTKGLLETNPSVKYSFPTMLHAVDYPVKRFEERTRENYSELWYLASNEKVVVVVRKSASVIEAITLFSYIFCAFLVLVGFFWLCALLLRFAGRIKDTRVLLQWNIRTQVHSTIIFISILSFVIIGVATISFFIKRYQENNREKLSRTMEIVVKELQEKLDKQRVFDDQIAIYDSVANEDVQKLVIEIAEFHSVEVNVYDTLGNLHVTSQPIIYREGYLSKKIHPVAFYNLNRLRQVRFTQQEKLSALTYMSIYAPLRSEGMAYAYLNIPYFFSQRELKPEISNFLVTIINLNAFIFLIAGVIALFITNRVTRSFSLISEKMRDVNLGRANEEIEWNRDDEIGGLVREYNKMVRKLEVSAGALARSEREGAWREMARQVAHEIKNPLTPMKLSIQYLQKSINSNSTNVKELTANVAKTLVEQIDHLSKIAFDFSQFANIGNTHPEKFDLREVLQSLAELYRVNDNVDIEMLNLDEEIMVYSDKTQMNRLFTNLLQNAVEAGNGQEKCRIAIQAVKEPGKVIVSVQDNGEGVPEEMKARIFAPNFTTKSSGTGLGLAICRGIVEQAKGNIWFETRKGEGSTFFVELPLVN
jgi:signal transduction histidine kinase